MRLHYACSRHNNEFPWGGKKGMNAEERRECQSRVRQDRLISLTLPTGRLVSVTRLLMHQRDLHEINIYATKVWIRLIFLFAFETK
jgi:hypothetical protein